MEIPSIIYAGVPSHGHVFGGEESLLLLLRRLAYPCRWIELSQEFGLYEEEMSELFNHMVNFTLKKFGKLLDDLHIWTPQLPYLTELIATKGVPSSLNVFGFIDGTLRSICRPKYGQQSQYSGHKRKHGFKFQSASLPIGLIAPI
jgi:hypothetical protein